MASAPTYYAPPMGPIPAPVPVAYQQPTAVPVPVTYQQPAAQPQWAPQPWHQQAPAPRPYIPAPPTPPAAPAPAMMPMMRPPQPQQQVLPTQQMQVPAQIVGLGWYGAFYDTMWAAVASAPPVIRPQMQGETFAQRFVKNMLAALGEVAAREAMFFFRQLIFAPPIPKTEIDVTPAGREAR